jgi:biopolymer transport protein ExbB/TolQ
MRLFFGNALWHLIEQSDFMIKGILVALLVASVACWALIFYKLNLFNLKDKQLRETSKKIRRVTTRQELLQLTNEEANTLSGLVLLEYVQEMQTIIQKKGRLSDRDIDYLDAKRFSVVDSLVYEEESYLSVLSVAAASGPLIGLFGTVWGLTNSFISISEKQSADIVTIAPGMAEALMTTMAGLMIAIPMLVMFHYLNGRVRHIEHALGYLSDQIHNVVVRVMGEGEEKHETILSNETPKRSFVPGN